MSSTATSATDIAAQAPSDGGAAGPGGWLLALHSSSGALGVGVLPWPGPAPAPGQGHPQAPLVQARLEHFATGRDLSNRLLGCLESVLPATEWPRLRRLAVATGPGGFTSTRLTVVLARTLAQQADLPLDGVSSFLLIARRLGCGARPPAAPFWLASELPRRGTVAGLYGCDPGDPGVIVELEAPRLRLPQEPLAGEVRPAEPLLPADVEQLLAISAANARRAVAAPWQEVVPHYPTSPVQQG